MILNEVQGSSLDETRKRVLGGGNRVLRGPEMGGTSMFKELKEGLI